MDRDALKALLFALGAAVVLAVGGWFFLSGSTSPGVSTTRGDVVDVDTEDTGASRDTGSRTLDVPRCPLQVRLGATFRRVETQHKNPNFRARSRARGIQVEIACRRAGRDFERSQFLDETLDAVQARFEGELGGEEKVASGPAAGWTTWRTSDGTMRLFDVLVRGRTIVTVNVFGPDSESTREANRTLLERGLQWPGYDATPPDASDASRVDVSADTSD